MSIGNMGINTIYVIFNQYSSNINNIEPLQIIKLPDIIYPPKTYGDKTNYTIVNNTSSNASMTDIATKEHSLVIKGLSAKTTEISLRNHATSSQIANIIYVNISQNGTGIMKFDNEAQCHKACAVLNFSQLHGNILHVYLPQTYNAAKKHKNKNKSPPDYLQFNEW
eukprot:41232_1